MESQEKHFFSEENHLLWHYAVIEVHPGYRVFFRL